MPSRQNKKTGIVEGQGRIIQSGVTDARGKPVVHQVSYVSPDPATVPLPPIRAVSSNARKQLVNQMTQPVAAQEQQVPEESPESSQEPSRKRGIELDSQDTSQLTETNDSKDRRYDPQILDDDKTVRMAEPSRFAAYPPLLRTFLEMGSENAISHLLTDVNRLDLDRKQKGDLLRRLKTQTDTIALHREETTKEEDGRKENKLYDAAYENTTVGEVASSLTNYVNYFINKYQKPEANREAHGWSAQAGSTFADVPRFEMRGDEWTGDVSKIILESFNDLPPESAFKSSWTNAIESSNVQSNQQILEAFRTDEVGPLSVEALYDKIVDDALIQYLPGAVNFLLNRINRKSNKPKKGIIDPTLDLKDDIIQIKHHVNQLLYDIRQPIIAQNETDLTTPIAKRAQNVEKIFNFYPVINKLIAAYTELDPGDQVFKHPHAAWTEIAQIPPVSTKDKNHKTEALNVITAVTQGTDLMALLDDLVKGRTEKPVMTHQNFLTVDDTGLYIQNVKPTPLDLVPKIIGTLLNFNAGAIGATVSNGLTYKEFTDKFNRYFDVLNGTTEAASPTEPTQVTPSETTEEVSGPRQITADKDYKEVQPEVSGSANGVELGEEPGESYSSSSTTQPPSHMGHANETSERTTKLLIKEHAKFGWTLSKTNEGLPPKPPTNIPDSPEESEIPLVDIYHQNPGLGGQVELLKNNQSQLEGLLARFLESRGEVLNTGDTNLMTQLENLFTKNQDELTAVNTELLAIRQRDAEREASKTILENTLTQLNTKIQSLEQELDNVRGGEYAQASELTNLQAGMTALEQEKGRLERSLVNREETILKQAEDNAFLKGEIQRQAINLGQYDHRYRSLEEALKGAQQNAQEAENRYMENLNKTSDTITRLQNELALKTRQLSEVQGGVNHNAALEDEIIMLQNRLSDANNKIAELEQGVDAASSVSVNAAALLNEINQLQEASRELRRDVQDARVENITQGNLVTELIERNMRRIVPWVTQLQEAKKMYHNAATKFQRDYEKRESEIKRVVELYRAEQQKAEQYREEVHRLQNTTSIAERRASQLGSHLLEIQQKTPIFKPSRSSSVASQSEVLTETQVLENEALGRLQKELEDARSNIKRLMDITVKQDAELSVTRAAHDDMAQQFNTMLEDNKRLRGLDEENKQLKAEVSNLDIIWKTSVRHEQDSREKEVQELEQIIEDTKRERDEIQARLEAEKEGLADIARQRDNEITELRERLEAYNRRSARVQFDLANVVREDSVERLKKRSKSFSSLDDFRSKMDAKAQFAAQIHELKMEERKQIHEFSMEKFQARAERQAQKEAFDRTHDAYKTMFLADKDLAKTNVSHAHQISKMGLGASLYKDKQQYDASLDIARQGIAGDQAIRAKAVKNHEAGKLIAKLTDSNNDGLRALGASMFANLLHDMATMTDDELKATNYADLIKMNDNGSIDKIIAALATPRHAVDDSLAKRISDLENTTRSFINMMSQRTAHVGAAQAYHPPRRVVMGRGPAGVGRSSVRAPRKGRAKSKPAARRPKRGGRRSKK